MDYLKKLWRQEQSYEPIEDGEPERDGRTQRRSGFSYTEYGIFLLLGVSMLWAWNMFLAAGPYFQHRLRKNGWMATNFQAAETSVSTVTNLLAMIVLTRMQANASYPRRIITSLLINMAVFTLLAVSTAIDTSAGIYFAFLMIMMFLGSLAAAFSQNGLFAYVSGFAQPGYTQGIMTGQAVAGVLPCIAQIISVLSALRSTQSPADDLLPSEPVPVPWTAALAYFLTATAISIITLLAFGYLLANAPSPAPAPAPPSPITAAEDDTDPLANSTTNIIASAYPPKRDPVSMLHLFSRLRWLALAVGLTFCVTMVFPVFTQFILSVQPVDEQGPLLQPACFIPLAFLFWNSGDLLGRLLTGWSRLSLVQRPRVVFVLSVARIVFVGAYYLCNIGGRGAVIESDFFYLVVVQLLFGLSNGFLGSTCMIGAAEWVEPEEREAAGGFMGLCLVGGLTVGSLLSFLISGT